MKTNKTASISAASFTSDDLIKAHKALAAQPPAKLYWFITSSQYTQFEKMVGKEYAEEAARKAARGYGFDDFIVTPDRIPHHEIRQPLVMHPHTDINAKG